MEVLYADNVFQDGLRQPPPYLLNSQPGATVPMCAEDVIITSEFQRRKSRAERPALELAALKYLTNFLTSGPFIVLNQLATILVQVCDAGSAGVTLEERRHSTETLQCVGAAGKLAAEQLEWVPRQSPCGTVIDSRRSEVFRRPARFYSSLRDGRVQIEELLVVPWQLSSGRRGAIWVAHHGPDRHLDPEDLRLVTTLSDFARHALQRSLSEETRRSCETLASAARVANRIAHEVNNPLQALINSLYLASATDNEHVLEAQIQAERVAELVRSVLELKRQEEPIGTK